FRNDGGRFVDVAPRIGLADARHTVGAVWFDHDEDGDLDVVVGNMDGDRNGLFRNDNGIFMDVADSAGIAWGGRAPGDPENGTVRPCAADVDGDGHVDLFFANYGRNGLFRNRGDGTFEDVSEAWGIAIDGRYDTCAFADIDHDGRLDLYVNGTITGGVSHPDRLFHGEDGRFVEVTPAELRLEADHGAQWADFDADGDADLALAGAQPEGTHALLRNMLEPAVAGRSLQVAVIDAARRALRPGAEVRVYAAGTRTLLGTRLVDAGSGYNAQSVLPVHVGLPVDGEVDVEVVFPLAGSRATTWVYRVDPRSTVGRPLEVRVPEREN
ncbi:MAG: CRTAC1 family protein, partial [Longimicrobiales bacterium]